MVIGDLRSNYLSNPMGYDLTNPVFSFVVLESTGKRLKWGRIRVSDREDMSHTIYDSGKIDELNSLGYKPDKSFPMGIKYYWQVECEADNGDYGISQVANFEGGICAERNDLELHWIGVGEKNKSNVTIFKDFSLNESKENIVSARLYICGLGLYEAYINGKKAGDEYLAPFYNDYRYWLQYETYDVTDLFDDNDNLIQVILGEGWYRGRFCYIADGVENIYGDENLLTAKVEIKYNSGKIQVINTDTTWRYNDSPIVRGNIYDGEVYNSNLDYTEKENKIAINHLKTNWEPTVSVEKPRGRLKERLSSPLGIQEKIVKPKLIITPLGEQVLDFGQEVTGWVEFDCQREKGREITLQYGEILQNGNFYRDNLRTAKAEFTVICNGEKIHIRPHFTFYGFRYVKVIGINIQGDELSKYDFTACIIYSHMEKTGKITTSNEKVNRLIENTIWGQKGNFVDVPTDCPQRDERLGWTGDAQVFCATASYHMDTRAFYRKYMTDMKYAQLEKNGAVPYVVPDVLTAVRERLGGETVKLWQDIWNEAGSCGWGDSATVIPWSLYLFYGDKNFLGDYYDNMKLWTDFIIDMDEKHCQGNRLWTVGFHFADWLALDNPDKNSCFGMTDKYFVASVYYMYSAFLTGMAAKTLGKYQDQEYYCNISNQVKEAIQKKYFTDTGDLLCDTQTGYVLAIYFDLAPEKYKDKMGQGLKKKLMENNMHLNTGFVGTAYLCKALTKAGLKREAYTLLLNEDYPSWLYEVNMGATTVWERWNSVLPDGRIGDTGMNSLNHYAYGAIAEWIYETVCGISPDPLGAGFKKIIFAPKPDERIGQVQCEYKSASGLYYSQIKYDGNIIRANINIPFDCSGDIIPPEGFYITKIKDNILAQERNISLDKIILDKGSYEILMEKY